MLVIENNDETVGYTYIKYKHRNIFYPKSFIEVYKYISE